MFISADRRPWANELCSFENGIVAYATQSICRTKSMSDISLPTACNVFSLFARADSMSARPSATPSALVLLTGGADADEDETELAPTPQTTLGSARTEAPAAGVDELEGALEDAVAVLPFSSDGWVDCGAPAGGRKTSSKLRAHPSLTATNKISNSFVLQLSRQKRQEVMTEYHLDWALVGQAHGGPHFSGTQEGTQTKEGSTWCRFGKSAMLLRICHLPRRDIDAC